MNKLNQKIPEEWSFLEFNKIATLRKNKYTPTIDEHLKCLELEHFEKGTGCLNGYIDSAQQSSTKNVFKSGDVLFGKLRPYLKKFNRPNFDGVCSTEIWVLNGLNTCKNSYLYLLIQTNKFSNICNVATGTHMPRADWNFVESIPFLLPPLAEQEKIAEILSVWDEAIEKLSGLIEQKKLLKKGLMQKLLTGKTRLSGFTQPWKTVKLGEIGKTYTGLSGKNSSDFGSGFPFITYMNIYLNNQIKNDQFEFVNIKENENQNAVKYGDIFFTTSSETPDEVGFASVLLFNPEVNTYLNSFCFGFRLNDFETLLPEFASFYFRSEDVRKIMLKLAQGATRFNLSKNELMKEKITIPSDITEQKAIADILQSCDLEIEKLKTKLDLLKLQKKGLMQQLLTGKIRVKVDK
ncbi:MAG: restriction endonuclease subunit S [Alphaproteobacteria bacterium]|nr:restriction endonuclease subunit S [Alphaproteobacteria bacterium]